MKIIFGAGLDGKKLIPEYKKEEICIYDNNKKLWGSEIEGINVIDFEKLLELVKIEENELILTIHHKSALYFIKELCENYEVNCKLYKYDSGVINILNIDNIEPYSLDLEQIAKTRLDGYEKAKEYYKQTGNTKAYEHACKYIEYRKNNLLSPELSGIELTNNCNLSCPNCPTPTCKRSKGFMSDEVFEQAFKYIPPALDTYFSMHGLGEPLLHPKFFEYLSRVAEIDKPLMISTNGVLLDDERIEKLFGILNNIYDSLVMISFHTKKSVENWKKCVDLLESNKEIKVKLSGQLLEHNSDMAKKWLKEVGIDNPEDNKYIQFAYSHSFAGNVSSRRKEFTKFEVNNKIRNCYFINRNISGISWDGRFKSCCLDSEVEGNVGNIFDIENARLNLKGYKLCRTCDPSWTNGFQ